MEEVGFVPISAWEASEFSADPTGNGILGMDYDYASTPLCTHMIVCEAGADRSVWLQIPPSLGVLHINGERLVLLCECRPERPDSCELWCFHSLLRA